MSQLRKLLLVSLDWNKPKDLGTMALGTASILAKTGHERTQALSYNVNSELEPRRVLSDIQRHSWYKNCDVAIGAYVWNERYVQYLTRELKQSEFPGRIIVGGPQISYTPPGQIEGYYPNTDVFIRGYAESAMAKLIGSEHKAPPIRGVHYRGDFDLGLSASASLEENPSPFLEGLIASKSGFLRWETQRGCLFNCSFCQHRAPDGYLRAKMLFDAERVLREIDWICSNGITDLAVVDPTFNSGPYYLNVLDRFISNRFQGKISLQCRAEMVKPQFLERIATLKAMGANPVLEFGIQTIHKEEMRAIKRMNNMQRIEGVLALCEEMSIATELSIIFGLPHQTLSTFKDSLSFCKQYSSTVYAFPLMLLRGTELHQKRDELGLVESNMVLPDEAVSGRVQHDNIPHVVQSPSFSIAEWREMARIAADLDQWNKSRKMESFLSQTMAAKH